MTKKTRRTGFSLVELVIVVVIIGVIAAIAVPRISRGARGAGDSSLKGTLAGLRNAIDMYAAEHGGTFPDGADTQALEEKLTKKTDITGAVGNPPVANQHIYGPYLRSGFPPLSVCAKKGEKGVKLVTGVPAYANEAGIGWVYSKDTGQIIANCEDTELDENNVKYNSY
jgi:prepilin-type N-terminal cleavage/methylation domain-containing protein